MFISTLLRQAVVGLAFLVLVAGSTKAGTLSGTVTEIHDGDTITIISLQRAVEVHLIGIVAPEKDQSYWDVARRHLSDLILNREVVVEFTDLGAKSRFAGRVFLKDADVGAQMIRDGAAWYDNASAGLLNENQRQVYLACQSAARSERRGLWQEANPLPPWKFKASLLLLGPQNSNSVVNTASGAQGFRKAGLTSESLLPSTGSARPLPSRAANVVPVSSDANWTRFTQPASMVSMLVPGDGITRSSRLALEDGRFLDLNIYRGRADRTAYIAVSSVGPNRGESDAQVMDSAVRGLVGGIQSDFRKLGTTFECTPAIHRDISIRGYAGREYDLGACTVPGKVRFYTRSANNIRDLYFGATFFLGPADDPKARFFFDSFTVNMPAGKRRPAVAKAIR